MTLAELLDDGYVEFVPATSSLTYEDNLGTTEPMHEPADNDILRSMADDGMRKLLGDISLADALARYNPDNDDAVTLLLVRLIVGGDA